MNTKIILRNRPNQTVTKDNFQCIDADIEPLKSGQVLVLNQWLSLDPYVRGRMSERKSYAPSMELGDVVIGEGIGIVLDSQSDQFKAGDKVIGMLGWQTHAIMNSTAIKLIPQTPFSETWLLGAAGMPGITAWIGMMDICKPQAGQTLFISSAAGSVGSVAGQLAKLQGANVVGVVGSEEKCAYVQDVLNFDSCLSYKHSSWPSNLNQSAPNGIDGIFENVGGTLFDELIPQMNPFSRIAICGLIAEGLEEHFHSINLRTLLAKRMLIQGFIVSDHVSRWREIQKQLIDLIVKQKIQVYEKITEGLQNAPQTFIDLLEGRCLGKQIIKLS
ncbi:NADP-dependent oxidoreductase [Polynucleobacter sp. Adler-ghost]|uniref:NADP-dependent oxidoreductase n=1 Tax=Polynucleobacter sp. Adler-ghost TaxID=2770234 RepID=UPI001BFD2B0D|nr:NADP-dependent oxidoreductase [Polynucleobacter sp. Adler-ghost]QWE31672.1 NADP-dependent oxidoreductase [Polynucleobacter sp. Adler-ghost]